MIPIPPSHCVNCRHIPSERESSSKSVSTVAPVAVKPETDSKYALTGSPSGEEPITPVAEPPLPGLRAAGHRLQEVVGEVEVSGDGRHFEALIVSPLFEGKRPVQRHQIVYGALGDRMREEVHALSMKTLTPDEYAQGGVSEAGR